MRLLCEYIYTGGLNEPPWEDQDLSGDLLQVGF